jgi:urease gamma subunit
MWRQRAGLISIVLGILLFVPIGNDSAIGIIKFVLSLGGFGLAIVALRNNQIVTGIVGLLINLISVALVIFFVGGLALMGSLMATGATVLKTDAVQQGIVSAVSAVNEEIKNADVIKTDHATIYLGKNGASFSFDYGKEWKWTSDEPENTASLIFKDVDVDGLYKTTTGQIALYEVDFRTTDLTASPIKEFIEEQVKKRLQDATILSSQDLTEEKTGISAPVLAISYANSNKFVIIAGIPEFENTDITKLDTLTIAVLETPNQADAKKHWLLFKDYVKAKIIYENYSHIPAIKK